MQSFSEQLLLLFFFIDAMAPPPCPPTLCRPQHLDRERIRAALNLARTSGPGAKPKDVLFHEAVVIAAPPHRPRAIQLLVLTRDAVLLLPLGGSISANAANVARLLLERIERFERVKAFNPAQKSLLLVPDSELYLLRLQEDDGKTTDYWISSFEPATRVFAHVARACRISFQRRLLCQSGVDDNLTPGDPDRALELSEQLETLLAELVDLLPDLTRLGDTVDSFHYCSQLLLELEAAIWCNQSLQRLVLENKTRIVLTKDTHEGSTVVGLPLLLRDILKTTTSTLTLTMHTTEERSEKWLELVSSVVRVLGAAIFDSQWLLPEHSIFFRMVSPEELACISQRCVIACYMASRAHERSEMWHVLWEELLDAHTALLLDLNDTDVEDNDRVTTALMEADGFWKWLEKNFKRICVGIGSVERYGSSLQTEFGGDDEDSGARLRPAHLWSLTLWRNVNFLDLLIQRHPDAVLQHFRAHLIDYVDFYLRSDRFLAIMRTSHATHVQDIAYRLDGLLQAFDKAASH